MTYDGTDLKLYVDGNLDGSMSVSGPITITTQPVRLRGGAPLGTEQLFLQGLVDEAQVINRALTAAELKAIFNAGSAGKCK